MKSIVWLCSFFIGLSAYASEIKPTKSGLYDVGGFSLYLECYENDKPKLIIESGFGLWGSDGIWLENIERLQSDFSICVYDRSGLGKSEKGPVPFTVNDTSKWLHTLLKAADIAGPYYFAGHSYGSYVIKSFNNQYPNDFLGAVLIDPTPFGYFYAMGTRWPENFQTDNKKLQGYINFERSVLDPMFKKVPENVDHMKSYAQLKNASMYGSKPIITIRSKKSEKRYDPPFVPDDIAKVMDELFDKSDIYFKGLSSNSRVIFSQSEKHNLHIADPDLVVKSIKELIGN